MTSCLPICLFWLFDYLSIGYLAIWCLLVYFASIWLFGYCGYLAIYLFSNFCYFGYLSICLYWLFVYLPILANCLFWLYFGYFYYFVFFVTMLTICLLLTIWFCLIVYFGYLLFCYLAILTILPSSKLEKLFCFVYVAI